MKQSPIHRRPGTPARIRSGGVSAPDSLTAPIVSVPAPGLPLRASTVSALQRTIGNQAVARLLQQPSHGSRIQRNYSDAFDKTIDETIQSALDMLVEFDSESGDMRNKFSADQIAHIRAAIKTLIDKNENFSNNLIHSIEFMMASLSPTEPITVGAVTAAYRKNGHIFSHLKGPGVLPAKVEEEVEEETGESLSSLIGKLGLSEAKAEMIEAHVAAYHQSRYYHMTRPGNVSSILKTGLDPRYGGSSEGLSHAHANRETAEMFKENSRGYVHLGKDYFSIDGMESTLKEKYTHEEPQYLRAFLDSKQKSRLNVDTDVDKGSTEGSKAWAVKTQMPILPHQIALGPFKNLAKDHQLKLCELIAQFYPTSIAPEVVLQNHLFSLENKLIYTDDPKNRYRVDKADRRERRYSF